MRVVNEVQSSEQMAALVRGIGSDTILLETDGELAAVLLSPERYKKIRELENENFRQLCREISEEAKANGLTEDILKQIMEEGDDGAPHVDC